MILLDTNVVSEAMRPLPDQHVRNWFNKQPMEMLYLSAITVAELRSGVALMPTGKRRTNMHNSLEQEILPLFVRRVLPFDMACTPIYAEMIAKARAAGVPIAPADGFIAAVALANGFAVATRDTSPFKAAGLKIIDPWNVT